MKIIFFSIFNWNRENGNGFFFGFYNIIIDILYRWNGDNNSVGSGNDSDDNSVGDNWQ